MTARKNVIPFNSKAILFVVQNFNLSSDILLSLYPVERVILCLP